LFIDIPLKAADRYFELYQVHSLPFFHEGLRKYVKIAEEFVYLAVAEDRQFFTTLTKEMLIKCTTDVYTICSSNMVLRKSTTDDCLIALFLGRTTSALKQCKRVITEDFEPVWIRSPDAKYWVYSLKKPTRITRKCRPGDSPSAEDEITEQTIAGTGTLYNTSTCYIYSETFKLLPHSLGRTIVGIDKAHIVLPDINNILKVEEQDLLQSHPDPQVAGQAIEDIIRREIKIVHHRGVDVNQVMEELRATRPQEVSTTKWIVGLSIGLSFCILLIAVGYYKRKTLKAFKTRWINRRSGLQPRPTKRRIVKPTQTTNRNNVLGTTEQQEKAEPEAGSRSPTPFVQRGRIPVSSTT
jgi:hypothetical protein